MSEDVEIRFEPLAANNEKAWDSLVREAHNGHLMALTSFFRYHAERFEDASLFIKRGKRPLGVLPANRVGDTVWSHQGVSFGGMILHPRTRFDHVEAAVAALVEHLRAAGVKTFMYRPAPHPYHRLPREEDVHFLEQAGARRVDSKLHSMVICGEPTAVRSKTWSKTVRRASDAGLRYRAGDESDLPAVWDLVQQRMERHGQPTVHTLDDMLLLRSRCGKGLPLSIIESEDGELMAGHINGHFGRTLTSFYLGDSERGRELSAGTLIHDHHLTSPENAGHWFDLGQWCDTTSRESSDTLLQYKESNGGRLIQRHTWQLDL